MPRIAVITGGSGAIGSAIASALVQQGCRVLLVARDPQRLQQAAQDSGGEPHIADITDLSFEDTLTHIAPDILVHSAAAYAPYARISDGNPADWERVFATGPLAAMRMARVAMPPMMARGYGRILLIGSLAAALGAHGQAAYATAKAAYGGLIRTLALEGGPYGVTANEIALGLIDTPRIDSAVRPEIRAALLAGSAIKRAGRTEEVGALAAFLCSDSASFLTGAVLPLSGGLGLGLPR